VALKLYENDSTASPSAVVSKKRLLCPDWAMLCWVSFAQMVSWGIIYYGFAVMMTPMGQDLGWTKAEMTGAFSLALALSGVAAIPVGFWLDKHGPRRLMSALSSPSRSSLRGLTSTLLPSSISCGRPLDS
jgi:MFS family permease